MASMDTPYLFNNNWVAVSLDEPPGLQVKLHVSIIISPSDTIFGSHLVVQLLAGAKLVPLTQVEGPDGDLPLPYVQSRGMTAFAQYTFDNQKQLEPKCLIVSLNDVMELFELK
jgi:hypothetical protein